MKVYELRADSNRYQGLIMPSGDLNAFTRRFHGMPFKNSWTDMKIEVDPDMASFRKGDFPSLISNIPIFSPRAVFALKDLLEPNGELLPVTCAGDEYYLYNTTRVVDALDESNSGMSRFADGRVFYIDHHAFFPERLQGLTIFKIPQLVQMHVFATNVFAERAESAGLKGFWFLPVWSSE